MSVQIQGLSIAKIGSQFGFFLILTVRIEQLEKDGIIGVVFQLGVYGFERIQHLTDMVKITVIGNDMIVVYH
jgi:hypothetical protein